MESNNSEQHPSGSHPGNQPDIYVKCPYFPEHELRQKRLPYHIVKCQKNPLAPKLVACPYNFLHRIKPEDRENHMILCPDRIRVKYADKEVPSYSKTLIKHFGIKNYKVEPAKDNDTTNEDGEEWW